MTAAAFLGVASDVGLGLLILGMLFTIIRIIRGPTLADRILGLDLITTLGIGFVGIIAIKTGFTLYVDLAIALGLVGFLSTIAFARYLLRQSDPKTGLRREVPE